RGFGAGAFGETILTERAAGFPQAFPRRDADLPPGAVADAGGEFVAVAGLGIGGPFVEPFDLAAEPRDRESVEQFRFGRLFRDGAVDFVQAEIVVAALEDREFRWPPEWFRQGLRQPGQIPVHQLPLEGDGGGGDHHRAPGADRVPQAGHQIGQGFPGARTGLDREMAFGLDGIVDRGHHGHLTRALLTAECGYGGRQQGRYGREFGHSGSLLRPTDTRARSREPCGPPRCRVVVSPFTAILLSSKVGSWRGNPIRCPTSAGVLLSSPEPTAASVPKPPRSWPVKGPPW